MYCWFRCWLCYLLWLWCSLFNPASDCIEVRRNKLSIAYTLQCLAVVSPCKLIGILFVANLYPAILLNMLLNFRHRNIRSLLLRFLFYLSISEFLCYTFHYIRRTISNSLYCFRSILLHLLIIGIGIVLCQKLDILQEITSSVSSNVIVRHDFHVVSSA